MRRNLIEMWGKLSELDKSLVVQPNQLQKLINKRIYPTEYSQDSLFHAMAVGKIALYKDFPSLLKNQTREIRDLICSALKTEPFGRETYRVRTGPSDTFKHRPLHEIVDAWSRKRAILGITDLHIRKLPVARILDLALLSRYNLLRNGNQNVASQEMMTMVMSSTGNVTDSHSDDPDGSNHCFVGEKIWLVWRTFEGMNSGLEDVSRVPIFESAQFDMDTFLALPSSRWFMVKSGETLFLPGDYTHKVITLDHYIGVGSFYVSLPNCLRTLSRWILHGPIWSLNDRLGENARLIESISRIATNRYMQLASVSSAGRNQWGYRYVQESVEALYRQTSKSSLGVLHNDSRYVKYLKAIT